MPHNLYIKIQIIPSNPSRRGHWCWEELSQHCFNTDITLRFVLPPSSSQDWAGSKSQFDVCWLHTGEEDVSAWGTNHRADKRSLVGSTGSIFSHVKVKHRDKSVAAISGDTSQLLSALCCYEKPLIGTTPVWLWILAWEGIAIPVFALETHFQHS